MYDITKSCSVKRSFQVLAQWIFNVTEYIKFTDKGLGSILQHCGLPWKIYSSLSFGVVKNKKFTIIIWKGYSNPPPFANHVPKAGSCFYTPTKRIYHNRLNVDPDIKIQPDIRFAKM